MLTTPILYEIVAFDAKKQQVFEFNVISGSQVTANRLIIKDNFSGDVIYDETVETFAFKHTIPADSLVNDNYYIAQVQTYDRDRNNSLLSNPIQFYCYTTPVITLTNIPEDGVINNSNYTFYASYMQIEGEKLESYSFNLYDFNGEKIDSSGVKYLGGSMPPVLLSHTFTGLEDNHRYFIDAQGMSVNGTVTSSGLHPISVEYNTPNVYSSILLENDCDQGWIKISSSLLLLDGESNPTPPKYINKQKVDLTKEETYVQWVKGYSIDADFTFSAWCERLNPNSTIVIIKNKNDSNKIKNRIQLSYFVEETENGEEAYVEALCYSESDIPYCIYSNYIPLPLNTDTLFIWLRKKNNLLSLELRNLTI